MRLTELTEEMRESMFQNRTNTTFEIDRTNLGFEKIETEVPSINTETFIEIPPIPMSMEVLPRVLFYSTQNERQGRWLLIMFRTYYIGGRIYYRRIDDNDFDVRVVFDNTNPNNN